ncbi:quinone-dependent dihydroorotate dehydrogenase [Flammeovirga pectinis]|uniref:Dihydroorotate dehydrogenase (quinone) n=1 Tax=Flammeovirga pectinis TaxID=2494373 RepID=A0A3S9P1X4_9BACT|nr:quinone-dependent dihydroorotate dehydrogenase [Flammeovirga pectinis]AZQ62162.1 quinone-dependent dihydroorotate dehydrogenase [Flammeovirga pectinis]
MSFYKSVVRPFLFQVDPEKIHHFAVNYLKTAFSLPLAKSIAKGIYQVNDPKLEREVFGIKFPSPVGLAAGFDKDAKMIDEFACFGFGFIEIGTLTPVGQPGNDKPRIFRLPPDQGLINRMGFNNEGVDAAVERLKKRTSKVIVGGNIGKNKVTPNEEAVLDYEKGFHALFDHVDYFTVNISSPNTPNLRALQDKEPLKELLGTLKKLNSEKANPKPILLKIAPDLTDDQLDDIIEVVQETKIDGVIATNTTISREGLSTPKEKVESIGMGGLSGVPVRNRSTEVIRYLYEKSGKTLDIIGVGGIHTAEDAIEKLEAGAKLVQVYTGFIYEGPALVKEINKAVLKKQY